MTNLQIITPFIFAAIFILLHYLFKGIKSARNNKNLELNIYNDLNNYVIKEISPNNFIAYFLPTGKFIYQHPINQKSIFVPYPISSELQHNKLDAFRKLETFIENLKK